MFVSMCVQTELKSVVQDALNNSENVDEKHISAQIKRKLDEQYGPTVRGDGCKLTQSEQRGEVTNAFLH